MLWQVIVASIGPRPEVDREGGYLNREGKATERERVFLALLDRTSIGQGQPVNRFSGWLSWLACASIGSAFWPRKPIFFSFFPF